MKDTRVLSKTSEYKTWHGMRVRCQYKNRGKYKNYAGRGIRVCKRWQKFENFIADMGPRPPGMTLDRIDNNGHYEPSNCRWATRKTQVRNRRNTLRFEHQGEYKTLAEWAPIVGYSYQNLYNVMSYNWGISLSQAIDRLRCLHRDKSKKYKVNRQ